jgi:hypothetical protein
MVRPTLTAMITPARKEAESLRGLGAVTKMSADMICGPAFMVMARGRIARFTALAPLVLFSGALRGRIGFTSRGYILRAGKCGVFTHRRISPG